MATLEIRRNEIYIEACVVVRPWDPPVPWDDLPALVTDPDDRLALTHAASLDARTGKAAT